MSPAAELLLSQILQLSRDEREFIATCLNDSLNPGDIHQELGPEWEAEIQRRIEAVDSGRMATIPWEEVRERLWAKQAGGWSSE